MKRRVFDKAQRGGQVLVTYEPATDTFRVATRPSSEATWGPPWTCIRWDDDPPGHPPPAIPGDLARIDAVIAAAARVLADPPTSRTDAEQAVIDAAIAETKAEDDTADEWSTAVTSARTVRRAAVERLAAVEGAT